MLHWQKKNDREVVRDILKHDGIIVCSTDTVYGLLAALSETAKQKLHLLKGDRKDKPFLILIAGVHKIAYFAELAPSLTDFLKQVWPGPVTCVVKTAAGTIALRAPNHAGLQELLEDFDGLYSTSANISGLAVPHAPQDIDPVLLAGTDAFIDGQMQLDKPVPSTILDCTNPDSIRVIREGAFPVATLEEIYGTAFGRN